jgi:hypothetical protein
MGRLCRVMARVQPEISSAGRLLHSLLSTAGSTPVPLRLFVTQASAQGFTRASPRLPRRSPILAKPVGES